MAEETFSRLEDALGIDPDLILLPTDITLSSHLRAEPSVPRECPLVVGETIPKAASQEEGGRSTLKVELREEDTPRKCERLDSPPSSSISPFLASSRKPIPATFLLTAFALFLRTASIDRSLVAGHRRPPFPLSFPVCYRFTLFLPARRRCTLLAPDSSSVITLTPPPAIDPDPTHSFLPDSSSNIFPDSVPYLPCQSRSPSSITSDLHNLFQPPRFPSPAASSPPEPLLSPPTTLIHIGANCPWGRETDVLPNALVESMQRGRHIGVRGAGRSCCEGGASGA
ncbi:hypothetical protein KSP40_PGU001153 [Platanthera guangdongensis]|uniref:Uncharacterized protein n=1 Tax=Platanthera guangdongensis TaxID=2320717 RepID=A0ABR2LLM0_9ASPA